MKYIIDTDILIYFLNGNETIVHKMSNLSLDLINTTVVNYAELLFGACNSSKKNQNLKKVKDFLSHFKLLPVCEGSASIFAEQKVKLKSAGNILADFDLLIASVCLKHEMVLVTNNVKHFARVKPLKIENWLKG